MFGINLLYVGLATFLGGLIFALTGLCRSLSLGEAFNAPKFGLSLLVGAAAAPIACLAAAQLPAETDLWLALVGAFMSGVGGTASTTTVGGLVANVTVTKTTPTG